MSIWLRGWIGLVAITAVGNTVQCFLNEDYPRQRIYTLQGELATPLVSRLFGVWTLLAAGIRLSYVVSPDNHSVYVLTLLSFVLAFFHFSSEVFVYKTAPLTVGAIAPMIVSGVSCLWMMLLN